LFTKVEFDELHKLRVSIDRLATAAEKIVSIAEKKEKDVKEKAK